MKRTGPKNIDLRMVSPNRGSNYTQETHVKRRLSLLSTQYTDIELKETRRLDRELGLDYANVARQYLNFFIFGHFKESIARLQEWDAAVSPPNDSASTS